MPGFIAEAWHVVEPNARYVHNWHIDVVSEHLTAITNGEINRLVINVPPGTMKSLMVSVMWQAYEWGPMGMRSMRYLATSYNDGPVKRDTRKCRDLILSDWFKWLWPEVVMTRSGETSFGNSDTGTREGTAFNSLTSQRGDRLVIDDPHSTKTAESSQIRNETSRQFREGAQNRLNDQYLSAIVVIMQRLHEQDVSGTIDEFGMDYVHLRLPMEFEAGKVKVGKKTYDPAIPNEIGFVDPRKTEGELLDPVRFPKEELDKLKTALGPHAYAGQYQQRPTAREGGLFKRAWFGEIIRVAPEGTRWVRHWDLAASKEKGSAQTAGVKLGLTPDGRYVVGDCKTTNEEGLEVRKLIKATAQLDGPKVKIHLPQDPGQAGKVQAQDMVAYLAPFSARAEPETGDKYTRAEPFSVQCEAGNVLLVEGPWNEAYIDQLCTFPGAALKDMVDASSGAFGSLQKGAGGFDWYVG